MSFPDVVDNCFTEQKIPYLFCNKQDAAASRVLKEKMEQMVYLLKALMLKIVNVDADYAHTFFEKLRKGYMRING